MTQIANVWKQLLDRQDVLIVDTETTGVGEHSEILDIALIDTIGRVVHDELILPRGPVTMAASLVHGLTCKRLLELGARPWPNAHSEVEAAIRSAKVLLAYNLAFDIRLLNQTSRQYGLSYRFGCESQQTCRCLMLDYAQWRGEPHHSRVGQYRWHKLEAAYRHECKQITQEHRALTDCKMTLELMRAVVEAGSPT